MNCDAFPISAGSTESSRDDPTQQAGQRADDRTH